MAKKKELNFEQRIKRLEEIEKNMNSGDLSLDENSQYFNESLEHIKICKKLLDSAQLEIKKVIDEKEVNFN